MSTPQFVTLIGLVVIGIAVIPWSVERAVDKRWGEIKSMFDRALMHGESLDTVKARIRADSEEYKANAKEALRQASGAVEAVAVLHRKVQRLEEHPLLRRLGGNHPGEGSE